jgi:hypothetical protein
VAGGRRDVAAGLADRTDRLAIRCARMIEEEGAEQVLVNLLHVLRECLGDRSSEE